jgi:hypothetical protein
MPRSHKQWRELPTFAILFFVCDPFFAALAVRAMVVLPWHIAAGIDTESQQIPPNLETRFYIDVRALA